MTPQPERAWLQHCVVVCSLWIILPFKDWLQWKDNIETSIKALMLGSTVGGNKDSRERWNILECFLLSIWISSPKPSTRTGDNISISFYILRHIMIGFLPNKHTITSFVVSIESIARITGTDSFFKCTLTDVITSTVVLSTSVNLCTISIITKVSNVWVYLYSASYTVIVLLRGRPPMF